MAKTVVKKKRRLKKTVRKTIGALFLASAVVVAAIPVDNLEAALPTGVEVGVDIMNCEIPIVGVGETIYTTGDGTYQFAYVSPNNTSSNNKVAVILGYTGGYLNNGALTIPDTVDAYLKYSDNLGTSSGYAAVGKSGNHLFYAVDEPIRDAITGEIVYKDVPRVDANDQPVLDDQGVQIIDKVMQTERIWYPCYYEDRASWQDLEVDQFYYDADPADGVEDYQLTITSNMQRIQDAEVWYIGNQYLKTGVDKDGNEVSGTWQVDNYITDKSKGIFAGQGNIRTLTVGEKLSGIGDFAFYGCSGLSSITLGNGLDTIGNSAFENCINLTNVNVDLYSRIGIIGAKAFYNCQALQSFQVPISVTSIGDSAFAECFSMKHIELCGNGANVSLTTLGPDVFAGCANLESLTFPRTYTNDGKAIDISIFDGCTALKFIAVSNNLLSFEDKKGYSFEDFQKDVPKEFYFEGLSNSPLHSLATEHNFAFSHYGQDLYEITVVDPDDSSIKAVYRVNSSNQLVFSDIDENMTDIELPQTIGPYKIKTIDSGTFQNNYTMKKLTVPSCIENIEADAFKGCYNLENVIFTEPVNISSIGSNAFKTQDVTIRDADGKLPTLAENPVLKFTGTISSSSVLYQYAMNPSNNINSGTQRRTYITYYSGWPENLEVRYNPNTDKNELVDYPTLRELKTGAKYTVSDYEYMTPEYETAAKEAVRKYIGSEDERNKMTDYEWEIINSALAIVLPEGIESIRENLFIDKENQEDNVEKSITSYSLVEIAPQSFKGCKNLKSIYLLGNTTSIGDYAFEDCEDLEEVYISENLQTLGLRPFKGCNKLLDVNFQGGEHFTCENSIIFELDESGKKDKVVQYLNARPTGVVEPAEMTGISELYPEAFMDSGVSSVDFKEAELTDVPSLAFASTPKLFSVYLNRGAVSISEDAFKDSALQYIEIPATVNYIDNNAFSGTTSKSGLTFYCEDDSNAKIYADKNGIKTTTKPDDTHYTVTFWDWNATLLDTQEIPAGQDATPPAVPGRPGYIHTGWVPDYHGINSDLQITAQYEAEDPDAHKLTVTFLDHDDSVLKTILVAPGADAEPPVDPKREGYMFTGWRPSITNIQQDTTIYAQYEKLDSTTTQFVVRFIDYNDTVLYTQKVNPGESAILPQSPAREGYTFTGWRPAITNITKDTDTYAQYERNLNTDSNNGNNGNNNGNNNDNNNGNNGNNGGNGSNDNNGGNGTTSSKVYNLTVRNGSGSGSYAAGSQPIIIADDPASGKVFSNWTIAPAGTKIASKVLSATVVTMPEGDVVVTAHYKNADKDTTTNNRPNSGTNVSGGGTTVVIDKNGLSNTGVVSATINGSSDNFTIKISESSVAAEQALKALKAQFGDISGIKYFPFDISLYDSKGTKKIYDTTGLSIKVTLPLPDSLVPYAGNSKVASVADGKLESLSAKFNTISGVPCITFTCEHFSPYVIYVNTDNLMAGGDVSGGGSGSGSGSGSGGGASDDTPKTGDGIHPKWFLSMGLACVAFVLFMKRDKRQLQTVKAVRK